VLATFCVLLLRLFFKAHAGKKGRRRKGRKQERKGGMEVGNQKGYTS
jgi:hypothetical protein